MSDCDMIRLLIGGKKAYNISKDPERPDAANVVVNMEFKSRRDQKLREDNIAKIILASSQVLFNDPRRRFTFSLSMEDTMIRFWWHSRAIVLISEEFDLFSEPERLVHFIVSLAFGTDAEVGFDPTVRRLAPRTGSNRTDKVQYEFSVDGEWYLSKRCINTYKASRTIGRGTRVWLVTDTTGKQLVLKDVWLSAGAKSEREIQAQIFADMGKNGPPSVPDYKKYFMKIHADEIVSIKGVPDIISEDIVRPYSLPAPYRGFFLFQHAPPELRPKSVPATSALRSSGTIPARMFILPENPSSKHSINRRFYESKKHCRILFEEYGDPLHDLSNHQLLLKALIDATTALQCMYSAGWVHRDISSGNLLRCEDGICRISDLEYARSYENPRSPSKVSKSGTPEFMAIEVQANGLKFVKKPPSDERAQQKRNTDSNNVVMKIKTWRDANGMVAVPPKADEAKTGIRHNYLHDLESVFWIALWCLYTTVPASHNMGDDELQLRLDKVERLFPHSLYGSDYRVEFFCLDDDKYLHEMHFLPPIHKAAGASLLQAKLAITTSYEKVEQFANPSGQDGFADAYPPVKEAFQGAIEFAATSAIRLGHSNHDQAAQRAVAGYGPGDVIDADPPSPSAGRGNKRQRLDNGSYKSTTTKKRPNHEFEHETPSSLEEFTQEMSRLLVAGC